MSKHTRGSWTVLPEEEGVHYIRIRGTRLGERYKIANVHMPDYNNPSRSEFVESRANARLIAAAPDLLEALQAMLVERSPAAQLSNACQQARSAIAKATGEQS